MDGCMLLLRCVRVEGRYLGTSPIPLGRVTLTLEKGWLAMDSHDVANLAADTWDER